MGVMLVKTLELGRKLTENLLECARVSTIPVLQPHITHESSICQCQLATSAEHILIGSVFAEQMLLIEEEFSKFVRIGQTLQA